MQDTEEYIVNAPGEENENCENKNEIRAEKDVREKNVDINECINKDYENKKVHVGMQIEGTGH